MSNSNNYSDDIRGTAKTARIILFIFFILLSIIVLLPVYAIFLASFKPGRELIRYGLNLDFDLDKMSFNNYVFLFTGKHSYFTWFKNSVILTVLQVVFTLAISSFVSYGLAVYDFKFKNLIFMCVLLILMVPFEILMLPLYQEIIRLNLVDTRAGIILPFIAQASTIFFFRQFYPHQ